MEASGCIHIFAKGWTLVTLIVFYPTFGDRSPPGRNVIEARVTGMVPVVTVGLAIHAMRVVYRVAEEADENFVKYKNSIIYPV